ncbi:MAG: tyrosine-type recombinase/integrase [Pseudomonadales bacterium]
MKFQILQDLLAEPELTNAFNPLYLRALLKESADRAIAQARHPFVEAYLGRLGVPDRLPREDALAFALQAAEERQRLFQTGGEVALKMRLAELRAEARSAVPQPTPSVPAPVPVYVPLAVADAVGRFLTDKGGLSHSASRGYKNRLSNLAAHLLRVGVASDVSAITREHLLAYRAELERSCSASSIHVYMTQVSTFLKWVAETQRSNLPMGWLSPAVRLQETSGYQQRPDKIDVRADEEGVRFSDIDLRLLVAQCSRGVHGDVQLGGKSRNGDTSKPKAWVLLLMAFGGFRPTEAAQLHTDQVDYDEDAGCYVVDVAAVIEGQRLKNKHSRRTVPLLFPVALVELFGQYLQEVKDLWGGFLFPWKVTAKGRLDEPVRRALADVTPLAGVSLDGGQTPYSFRHTLLDRCKQLGLEERYTKALAGHAEFDITAGRYGKRTQLGRLVVAMRDVGVADFSINSQ